MDQLKRFIDIYVPIESCTLRCDYCYITHHRLFNNKLPKFNYDADTIRKALSKERLGGTCLLNLCAGGETLLAPEMPQYIKALLEEGHYVMVVTNATVDRAFNEMATWPKDLLERLFFKFSYHYMELKKRNLFDRFFNNIRKMRDAGASFTLELTPYDDLVPYIDELKQKAFEELGAIPHVTVARDEHYMGVKPILTKMTREEYQKTWSVFDSKLFDFKFSIFGVKRKEFCYAGAWTGYLNMQTGTLIQCYGFGWTQNIFDDIEKPIKWRPVANCCQEPHCFNGHSWIGLGAIPEIDAPTYAEMRNRVCIDGTEWLQPKMHAFMSQRLYDNNLQITPPPSKFMPNCVMWWWKIKVKYIEKSRRCLLKFCRIN
ncbi:MAG: radical SAM protein [Paludibacteraceae bacterium]|nr:radical SAM protein [Paludibacteraceae bacterium]